MHKPELISIDVSVYRDREEKSLEKKTDTENWHGKRFFIRLTNKGLRTAFRICKPLWLWVGFLRYNLIAGAIIAKIRYKYRAFTEKRPSRK